MSARIVDDGATKEAPKPPSNECMGLRAHSKQNVWRDGKLKTWEWRCTTCGTTGKDAGRSDQ